MEIKFSIEPEFLKVELNGSFTQDAFVDFLKLLGKKDSEFIYIDASQLQNTNLTYQERFDIVNVSVANLNFIAKIAIVWPARDINNFIIDNMQRHGHNIQIFGEPNQAKRWLLKKG
ncbi:hypothetical protein JBL43_18630 [Aureibaculum sp. A20]|uniref:STAS/SEC14 domain-containing protein n=1 Tax=Aureibaculum flavum TaxID=2795986 RepID=A0ABS0WWB9_9FLAO|nr:hypothetical protein [Aureibaculum flavum]MBJ2176274.1 hypothetical protein [Aureibaculum flavum]